MAVKVRCDDEVLVHIDSVVTDHLTACGMDGNDESPLADQENLGDTKEKVNCSQCIQMWKHFRAIKPSKIDKNCMLE